MASEVSKTSGRVVKAGFCSSYTQRALLMACNSSQSSKSILDRQLRYFLVCAHELSFTRAAERLDISQSALSQQIRQLEDLLEQTLFLRKGRGITLTTAGTELLDKTEPHFLGIDKAVDELKYQQGISEGTISIAGVHPVLSYLLPDLITDYARRHPKVKFNLRCGGSAEAIELTNNQTVNFGLIYDNVASDIRKETIYTEQLEAVFSSKLLQAKEILETKTLPENTPLVLCQPSYSLRRIVDNALNAIEPRIQFETEAVDSLLNLTREGAGVCFLPSYIFCQHPDLYHCPLDNIKMQVPVAIITKANTPTPALVLDLIDEIKAIVKLRGL